VTESAVDSSWQDLLEREFAQDYYCDLMAFLEKRKAAGANIFPPQEVWFSALASTPLTDVKVVILGQDPYHAEGQAHGLCFSVLPGVKTPPSLKNIYKELHRDLHLPIPRHGCLDSWAKQGVLLLNTVFTVEEGKAGSHQGKGWERFSEALISTLNTEREGLVFMLWGAQAQKKGADIDQDRHLVLRAAHPSPLSAHRGFLGCGHFSQANAYLRARGQQAVDWQIPVLPEPAFQLIP
jgi:uracil-DNA glycosylase